jgi:uncharacterized protein YndB with AHSA1/START domain
MLRWAIYIVVGLVGLAGVVALIGWTLPVTHMASRTITLNAPPEQVFDLISDFARAAEWRGSITRVEMLPDDGKGPLFREHSSMGPMLMRAEVIERPGRLVTRIADPSLPFGGTWTHTLRALPSGGTEHTVTEDGEIYNVFFRAMARFIFGYTSTIEEYQTALATFLGAGKK